MIGRPAVLPSLLVCLYLLSLTPAPRAASDSPLKLADLAWDRGDYPTALNGYLQILDSPQGDASLEAIALRTPASLYTASARPFPERLPPLEYPAHFQTRYVSHNNGFRWRSQCVRVSSTVVGGYLGLEEIDNGVWDVYYGALKLGRLLEEHMRIEDAYGSLWRYRQKL